MLMLIVMNGKGLSRKHILAAAEAFCQAFGTYIDVLQIHRLDHEVLMKKSCIH